MALWRASGHKSGILLPRYPEPTVELRPSGIWAKTDRIHPQLEVRRACYAAMIGPGILRIPRRHGKSRPKPMAEWRRVGSHARSGI